MHRDADVDDPESIHKCQKIDFKNFFFDMYL